MEWNELTVSKKLGREGKKETRSPNSPEGGRKRFHVPLSESPLRVLPTHRQYRTA